VTVGVGCGRGFCRTRLVLTDEGKRNRRSPLSGNSKRALFKTEDSLKAA
jgi:hypothetical protein